MKKKAMLALIAFGAILFFLGSWLDGLSGKAKLDMVKNIEKWQETVSILKSKPSPNETAFKEAENLYASCEKHLFNFMVFLKNGPEDNIGEERDMASKSCKTAQEMASSLALSKNDNERFHAFYSLGNINVRLAMLAVSQEEQMTALKEAINAYIEALQIRDDYEAKFNLELLISINEQARGAASGKLSPDAFKLNPTPHGASPGQGGKSKL